MATRSAAIVQRVWNYAHVLKDDGLAFMDYTEQITYLLFLKMAWERGESSGAYQIPSRYNWKTLRNIADDKMLAARYHQALRKFSEQPGLLGLIFTKPQSKINDPAKLRRLIELIDSEDWSSLDVDVKGEVYEGLLAKNADDVRGGAGQYFTPRPVIRAIVEAMQPASGMKIADPACGTGGFLLAAYEYLNAHVKSASQRRFLKARALHGTDIVPNVARLCAMNLYLHGIGSDPKHPVISIEDSLATKPKLVDMVLTNPPFGKKSSITIIGDGGKRQAERIFYERQDFWATTSNKQLNFVQHVYSMLKDHGRAAVVVPDNVLFEGGAGEKIRRALLQRCDVHTLLRLPSGIWYSTGVQANVIFFDKKPLRKKPSTTELWVYDLRTNQNFTQRNSPISESDLTDFVKCYKPEKRSTRRETERFKRFTFAEIMARDKASLDIHWINDEAQESPIKLQSPHFLVRQVLRELQDALNEFASVEEELGRSE